MKLEELNIFYINLSKNEDRNNYMINQFEKLNITNYKRFDGIDGQKLSDEDKKFWLDKKNFKTLVSYLSNKTNQQKVLGRVGCFLSHMNCLRNAINNNLDNILILEDDVNILGLKEFFNCFIPENIDLYYLGGTFWNSKKSNKKLNLIGSNLKIDINICKVAAGSSYLINSKEKIKYIYDILNNVKPSAIDNLLINHIQKLGNSYICEPQLCFHNDSFISDVSNFGKPNIIGRGKYNELRLNYFD